MMLAWRETKQIYKTEPETKASIQTQPPIRLSDFILVIAVVVVWGVAFVGMKEMVKDAPPFKAGGLRFLIGSIPLLVLALQPKRLRELRLVDFGKFAIVGFFQTTILFGINFHALQFVPAGVSSIILNTNPFFVAVMAHFLIAGDRLNRQKIFGLVLGFSGVLVLVLGGKGLGEVALYWPVILIIAASVWAFSSVLVKLFKFKDMISLTAWQSFFGALPLLVLGYSFEPEPVQWTGSFIFWTLYVAIIGSSFAWWAWYRVLQRYNASRISVFLFLIPVCGVLSGVILLGESMTLNLLFGGALVAAGIIVVNLGRKVLQPGARPETKTVLNNGEN
jgi:drug/metabolite transporter (DMT)-like permease